MKNIKKLLLISIVIFISCVKKDDTDNIILSGKVNHTTIDSIQIKNSDRSNYHTIHLTKENTFNDTISAHEGYYYLSDNHNLIWVFFKPSFNLNSTISYKENGVKLVFEGEGANENNYLQQKNQFDETFKDVENSKHFLSLNEEDFLKLSDSIYRVKKNFLQKHKDLDEDFRFYESFSIENNRASLLNRYYMWRGYFLKKKDFKVSENYPDPFENIDINNEKLLAHPYYTRCLSDFIAFKIEGKEIEDKTLTKLETIDKEIKNQKIKDELAYSSMKFGIARTKMLDEVYNMYISMVENKVYKKEIEKIYLNYKKISKGTISPTFKLYDINNKLVSLESLKGTLVYIDIWATWCIPCIREIPALKKLEKEFESENIEFVSICFSDTKENFEKMVKEKEMGGVQLFAPDDTISFFKDYFVSSIPRFILIDQDGKIIDGNAYKPSDPKLKEQLKELLP